MIFDEPSMFEVCKAFNLKGVHPAAEVFRLLTGEKFQELCQSIGKDGLEHPVVLTHDGYVIDGRNRLRALLVTGQTERFETLDVVYAKDNYIGYVERVNMRRDLEPGERAMGYAALARMKAGSNQHKPVVVDAVAVTVPDADDFALAVSEKVVPQICVTTLTTAQAAEKAGVHINTMAHAIAVDRKGSPELIDAVKRGEIAVSAAAKVVQALPDHAQQNAAVAAAKDKPRTIVTIAKAEAEKPKFRGQYATLETWQAMSEVEQTEFMRQRDAGFKFNKQGDAATDSMGNIEWADWSWNPVTGCLHDCPYCYARDIAERFYEQRFAPSFWPGRLAGPKNMKVPASADLDISKKNVFSNSMSDLYGRWVPDVWINAVLDTMRDSPEWNFLMLTKFPNKAAEFKYSPNCWIGASVDMQARVKVTEAAFERIDCGVKWLSLEPLIEPLTFSKPQLFNWVVIGGASKSTKTPEWVPPAEWIIRTASQFLDHGAKIYMKTNGRPREYPGTITPATADEVFHYLKSAKV